jgi:excisionase family DNA binding protein
MNPKEIDHEILTVKEISDLLQVHQSTIYKMVRQGKIPSFRVGADWRFRKDLIERWMAEKSMSAGQVRKVIESGINRLGCNFSNNTASCQTELYRREPMRTKRRGGRGLAGALSCRIHQRAGLRVM